MREKASYPTVESYPSPKTEETAPTSSAQSAPPSSHSHSSSSPSYTTAHVFPHSPSRTTRRLLLLLKQNRHCLHNPCHQFLWLPERLLDRYRDCIGTRTVVDGNCSYRPQICPKDSPHRSSCLPDSTWSDHSRSKFCVHFL